MVSLPCTVSPPFVAEGESKACERQSWLHSTFETLNGMTVSNAPVSVSRRRFDPRSEIHRRHPGHFHVARHANQPITLESGWAVSEVMAARITRPRPGTAAARFWPLRAAPVGDWDSGSGTSNEPISAQCVAS